MTSKYNYEVMFDDKSIDVSKEVSLVWSIANSLRGAYTSDKYKDVMIALFSKVDLKSLRRLRQRLKAKQKKITPK